MALNEAAQKIIANTQSITHSFGPTGTDNVPIGHGPAPMPMAAGPTGFWSRIAQVGIQKVTQIEKAAAPVVSGVAKAVVSAPVDIAKEANKNVVQPLLAPKKGQGAENLLALQSKYQGMIKRGQVDTRVQAEAKHISSVQDKTAFLKMVTSGKSAQEQLDFIKQSATKGGNQVKRAVGDLAQVLPVTPAASEAKAIVKGSEAIKAAKPLVTPGRVEKTVQTFKKGGKAAAPLAGSGASANAGYELAQNPGASVKDVTKAAVVGAATGTALKGAGQAIKGVRQVFKEGPQASLDRIRSTPKPGKTMEDVMTPEQADKARAAAHTQINVRDESAIQSRVPVKTPVRPGIKEVSETNKINVRTPVKITDQEYTKQFKTIENAHDKASKALKDLSPAEQKVRQTVIDNQAQKSLDKLDHSFTHGVMPEKTTIKKIASSTSPAGKTTGGIPKFASKVTDSSKTYSTGESRQIASTLAGKKAPEMKAKSGAAVPTSVVKSEARAVEAGLVKELGEKASYKQTSYAGDAENAVRLAHENPQKALDIATGKKRGTSPSHEVAVRRAVETKATKEGDVETIQRLAASPRHAETSQAAQRLGAEAFNASHDSPVEHIRQISEARAKAAKVEDTHVNQVARDIDKEIEARSPKVSKDVWSTFVESIKC